MKPPTIDAMPDIASVKRSVQLYRLPLASFSWRGARGNWLGKDIGTSLDFHDFRNYIPGDDPRNIHWQAYARTGNYFLKQFHEEVSPSIDLILDTSSSMAIFPKKKQRALELFYFLALSCEKAGASLRLWKCAEATHKRVPTREALACRFDFTAANSSIPPAFRLIPSRAGSLRIIVSDFLFPVESAPLAPASGGAKPLVFCFAVRHSLEEDPDWDGNLELVDIETGSSREQKITPQLLAEYRAAYKRHFGLWKAEVRKVGGTFTVIPSSVPLAEAIAKFALADRALECVQ